MNLNNWMASIKSSTPLFSISIPGTHDSCAIYDHATAGYTQTQWWSITQQLENGIRFLDIRPAYELNGNQFEINHGGYDQNINFAAVQQEVVAFLQANPSEVVLMSVQQEYTREPNDNFVARFNAIVDRHENYWFFEERIPELGEVRGKIVLIRGYDPTNFNPDHPANGGWLTNKGIPLNALTSEGFSENKYFRTQNGSMDYEKDKVVAIEKLINQGVVDNRFALNYLSYAHFGATPGKNAEAMNPLIYTYLQNQSPKALVGVLPMDFAGNTPGFIEEIIQHNLPLYNVVAADFFGTGKKEVAVFIDKGNNTTGLSLFRKDDSGRLQLRELWSSAIGSWETAGMTSIHTGDFLGAGKEDIAIFYNYSNGRTCLWLFSSENTFEPKRYWDSGSGAWDAYKMCDPIVGDFSGSGKTEIAIFYNYGADRTCLWLFAKDHDFQPQCLCDSEVGNWNAQRMPKAYAGNFSGSGKTEIAVFYDYGNGRTCLWLFAEHNKFKPARLWDSGVNNWNAAAFPNVIVGDFTGKGKTELAGFYNYGESTTALWLFSAISNFQPATLWNSGVGHWDARQMSSIFVNNIPGTSKAEINVFYNYGQDQTKLWSFSSSRDQPELLWDSGANNWRATAVSDVISGKLFNSTDAETLAFYNYNCSRLGIWSFHIENGAASPRIIWEGKI